MKKLPDIIKKARKFINSVKDREKKKDFISGFNSAINFIEPYYKIERSKK
jgi:hypothetical protein